MDLLVIRKKPGEVIKNEIGAFFLGHNIIEYKSPDDSMNIDTFYKVLSYACLYKADTGAVDEILDTDITVSLIRERKPVKLLGQLEKKYQVKQGGKGIYRIDGMLFPMQVIVTRELEAERHVWLKSLTRNMDIVQAEELLDSFDRLEAEEARVKAAVVVNLVSDLNSGVFEQIVNGGDRMSEALKRMILPELGELKELLADKDAEIADKDARIADKDAEIADKDAEIADKDAEIADKDARIADKDAEIAALKRMLAEKEGNC
ncbi:MAG: hypothetical protein K2L86_06005 [Lachnospiraceae bacterium]|nr:hypothetical protein [Lachnospiraceae bacterium]